MLAVLAMAGAALAITLAFPDVTVWRFVWILFGVVLTVFAAGLMGKIH